MAFRGLRCCVDHLWPALLGGFLTGAAHSESLIISTIAGGGVGDGSLALSVSVERPSGVSVDVHGNLFLAIPHEGRIRKVAPGTGIIMTVVGNGSFGFSGDGGRANHAGLNLPSPLGVPGPTGIAFDTVGNLYFADRGNNRIRKVSVATGVITTVAGNGASGFSGDGGSAANASMSSPSGLAFDGHGNLHVADNRNNRVRRIDAITGVIETVAGNGTEGFGGDGGLATAASLYGPSGISFDADGNLYFSDSNNQRVRKVAVGTGIITTVAGRGFGPFGTFFAGDGGPATEALLLGPQGIALDSRGNLFISDRGNDRVRRVSADTGVITSVAAGLFAPNDIAIDAGENLYIADSEHHRIQKLSISSGGVTTVAGNRTTRFGGDGGPATSATFNDPSHVATDSSGNVYVADMSNARVRKVTVATGLISTVAGGGFDIDGDGVAASDANLPNPSGIALDATGNLYVSSRSRVRRVDAGSGRITTVAGNRLAGFGGDGGPATNATLNVPGALTLDAGGSLYISDSNRIRKVAAGTGIITTVAGNGRSGYSGDGGPATSATFDGGGAMAFDAEGNLHFADSGRIRKVAANTGVITTVVGNGTGSYSGDGGHAADAGISPGGIAFDAAGNLYIGDSRSRRIRKVDAASGVITTIAGRGSSGFSGDGGPALAAALSAGSIALDAMGTIYLADRANHRVRKLATGTVANYQGLWWKSPAGSESGWGLNLAHQGEILFGTWFTYDADGSGLWLVMPNAAITEDRAYSGLIYRTTGPAFDAVPWSPAQVTLSLVGTASLKFNDNHNGAFDYTVNGIAQTKLITRQVFASPVPTCTPSDATAASANYQDLWWRSPAGSESGWGVNVTHQGDTLFATWFTYDASGKALWLVMPNGTRTGAGSYSGSMYRTTGPAYGSVPWTPANVTRTEVGTATFAFSNANNGSFTYLVGGASQSKAITRQVFSTPTTACN